MSRNPYAPPQAKVEGAQSAGDSPLAPHVADVLYSPNQIFCAALLGGPVAAGWIASTNFNAIGQADEGRKVIGWSIAVCIVLLGVGVFLPDNFPALVLPLACSFGIRAAAQMKFGAVVKDHLAAGGLLGSWWRLLGRVALCVVLVIAFAFAVLVVLAAFGVNIP